MKNKMINLLAVIGLGVAVPVVSQAEVLVILPASGNMAAAADSVRDGLQSAYYAGKNQPTLRFIDNSHRPIQDILNKEINAKTELVIGPLAREQVEHLIIAKPKVKVLALNQASQTARNVWQFALSPDEDARALTHQMGQDGVSEVLVLTQPEQQRATVRFHEAMGRLWGNKLVDINELPAKLTSHQGILLLGDNQWLTNLGLPQNHTYTIPLGVVQKASMPVGVQFCDTPGLYSANWPDLLDAYKKKPVDMAYQRLLAFGGDAWELATHILNNDSKADFAGRTGQIRMVQNVIDRQPQCMQVTKSGLLFK